MHVITAGGVLIGPQISVRYFVGNASIGPEDVIFAAFSRNKGDLRSITLDARAINGLEATGSHEGIGSQPAQRFPFGVSLFAEFDAKEQTSFESMVGVLASEVG